MDDVTILQTLFEAVDSLNKSRQKSALINETRMKSIFEPHNLCHLTIFHCCHPVWRFVFIAENNISSVWTTHKTKFCNTLKEVHLKTTDNDSSIFRPPSRRHHGFHPSLCSCPSWQHAVHSILCQPRCRKYLRHGKLPVKHQADQRNARTTGCTSQEGSS